MEKGLKEPFSNFLVFLTSERGLSQNTVLAYEADIRFFVEFLKENQSYFEEGLMFNMGQLLSIPFILFGIFLLFRKEKKIIKIQ